MSDICATSIYHLLSTYSSSGSHCVEFTTYLQIHLNSKTLEFDVRTDNISPRCAHGLVHHSEVRILLCKVLIIILIHPILSCGIATNFSVFHHVKEFIYLAIISAVFCISMLHFLHIHREIVQFWYVAQN